MSFYKVAEGVRNVAENPIKEKTAAAGSERDAEISRVFEDNVLTDIGDDSYETWLISEDLKRPNASPSQDSSLLFNLDNEPTDTESYFYLQSILKGAPITRTVQNPVQEQSDFTYVAPIPESREPAEQTRVKREPEPVLRPKVIKNEGWDKRHSMVFDGDSYRSSKQILQVKEEPKPDLKQQLDLSAKRPGVRARPPARVNLDELQLQEGSKVPFKYENKPLGKEPLGPAPQLKPRKAKVNRPIASGNEFVVYEDYARVTKGTAWTERKVHEDYEKKFENYEQTRLEKEKKVTVEKRKKATMAKLARVSIEEEQGFVQAELKHNPGLAAFMPQPTVVANSTSVDPDPFFMRDEVTNLGFEEAQYYADFEELLQPKTAPSKLALSSEFLSDTQ
jgi:hypothetical protein